MTASHAGDFPAGPVNEDGSASPLGLRDPSAYFTTNPIYQSTSVWMTGQQDAKTQRAGRYVPASVAHPAKMFPAIAAHAINHFTRPGDVVLDPMCGIGTTLVEAVHLGRHGIGVEYEPRWAALSRASLSLARSAGAAGVGRVVCADARDLPKVVRPAVSDVVETLRRIGPGCRDDLAEPASVQRPVSLILTSPPYGNHVHGRVSTDGPGTGITKFYARYGDPRDAGNLAHADMEGLLAGFTSILAGAVTLLRPGGHVVLTARPFRRGGELVDLPTAVIRAAEDAGLMLVERTVALTAGLRDERIIPRTSFFQLWWMRQARAAGVPQQVVIHEDVLVFRLGLSSIHGTRRAPSSGAAPSGRKVAIAA